MNLRSFYSHAGKKVKKTASFEAGLVLRQDQPFGQPTGAYSAAAVVVQDQPLAGSRTIVIVAVDPTDGAPLSVQTIPGLGVVTTLRVQCCELALAPISDVEGDDVPVLSLSS